MTSPRTQPTSAQIAATDPSRSNWVGANAGSGKTHVLTQRVARLLLAGSAPQKILCLTYTKAAANEMQTRLFRVLGEWAMEPQEALATRLGELTGQPHPVDDPEQIAQARRLFARALETPGGLKIQTIHAFCDALLRRFPLEAGVSPRFEVMDDRQSILMLSDVRARMGRDAETGADAAFDAAARRLNEADVDALIRTILSRRHAFDGDDLDARIEVHFGEVEEHSEHDMATIALDALDWPRLGGLASVLHQTGGKTELPLASALSVSPEDRATDPYAAAQAIIWAVLTQKAEPRSTRNFPTKAVKAARPDAEAEYAELTEWALHTLNWFFMKVAATRTRDLHVFARGLLSRYEEAKRARGLLDFDDLVVRARNLLTRQDMRGWVLFKLDQGIDHILVDEAQDTSPLQWQIIAAIAEEFLAGDGARGEGRSIFVVGDEKQSIYSFQGAEPQAFGTMRSHFANRLAALGGPLGQPGLVTSFRSAPAVLEFVDAVFTGEAADGLTVERGTIVHAAHRKNDQGRIDLWPPVEPVDRPQPAPWWEPVDTTSTDDARERLATTLARHIRDLTTTGTLPATGGQPGRAVRPGDIMVLVTRRDALARGIIRALKTLGVPVAGADRLSLAAELAVKDMLALIKVSVMPGDNLSLAALLRSPLCGMTEDELFGLAHARTGTLWQALQASDQFSGIYAFLSDMAGRADFLRPYEFLERALIHHGGRLKLLARLGTEAEDPLDELLAQALSFEMREIPSLTGFVAWIEASDITVKREMESGTDEVRLMTVHGAKGLEAPIVILPDTFSGQAAGGSQKLFATVTGADQPELTLWAGSSKLDDQVTARAREAAHAREQAERRRLLYVALTRAESWLILCGARPRRSVETCWYDLISAGMGRLDPIELPSPTGEGTMRRFESGAAATTDIPAPIAEPRAIPPIKPAWLSPAPAEKRPLRLSPSTLGKTDEIQAPGTGADREHALAHGTLVHQILEHHRHADPAWRVAAQRIMDQGDALSPQHRDAILAEIAAIEAMPEAAILFGPDALAEIGVSVRVPNGPPMIGRVDRLVHDAAGVLIVDFKSDVTVPRTPTDVPTGYLAQLGAYRSAVQSTYAGQRVRAAILWTRAPLMMELDTPLVDTAFAEAVAQYQQTAELDVAAPT